MPKLIYYRDKCIGCGVCQEMQPELWRLSKKDGQAVLLQASVKKGIYQLMTPLPSIQVTGKVIAACPARAIRLV